MVLSLAEAMRAHLRSRNVGLPDSEIAGLAELAVDMFVEEPTREMPEKLLRELRERAAAA